MHSEQLLNTIVTVVLAVVGWRIGHFFNSRRDRELKRRELVTAHLINAYRVLAEDITHRPASPERDSKLESVIAELQLFGSINQVALAKKMATDIVNNDTFQVDDLLNDLRSELRKELGLTNIDGNVVWLRFQKKDSVVLLSPTSSVDIAQQNSSKILMPK